VSKAEWNQNTKLLTLVYNPKIVTNDAVQKKIASVGHDTEKYRADDKAYNSLPGCCKYR
jgi:mercuric ion binding protein